MSNLSQELMSQSLPPTTLPTTIATHGPVPFTGWEIFEMLAFAGGLLLVLALLFILAMKVIYWITRAVTRGVHDGWTPTHTKIAHGIFAHLWK